MNKLTKGIIKIAKLFQKVFIPKTVFIYDYEYVQKYRGSLESSRIGELIEDWYAGNKDEVLNLIDNICSHKSNYEEIALNSKTNDAPSWNNLYITPFDAISIYGFLAKKNPRYYVEVGSGNTTLFAAQSIKDNNLRTKIISIDPYPRSEISELCHEVYRMPLENMDLEFFNRLSGEDILLIDNSHRSFQNSDVTVFFTEVLPKLPAGMLYALHDIFLPMDYPEKWSHVPDRFYNEQYLLCTYILGGANGDKIIAPLAFLSNKDEVVQALDAIIKKPLFGTFFWMEKHGSSF